MGRTTIEQTKKRILKNKINITADMLLKLESFIKQLTPNEENGEIIRTATKTLLAMQKTNMAKIQTSHTITNKRTNY